MLGGTDTDIAADIPDDGRSFYYQKWYFVFDNFCGLIQLLFYLFIIDFPLC